MRIIFSVAVCMFLIGCVSFGSSVPDTYKEGEYFYLEPEWLKANEKDISERLTNTIRAKHPITAEWFPRVSIANIDVEDNLARWRDTPALKENMNSIFRATLGALYPNLPAESVFNVNLKIRNANTDLNPALYALMVPYGVACWSTLMLVCPVSGKSIVVVEATFEDVKGNEVVLRGAGASRLVAISPYAGDSPLWADQAETKALIAAMSRLTDEFVKYSENEYQTQLRN